MKLTRTRLATVGGVLALAMIGLTGCGAPAAPTTAATTSEEPTAEPTETETETPIGGDVLEDCAVFAGVDASAVEAASSDIDPSDPASVQGAIDAFGAYADDLAAAAATMGDASVRDASLAYADALGAYADQLQQIIDDPAALDQEAFQGALTEFVDSLTAVTEVCAAG